MIGRHTIPELDTPVLLGDRGRFWQVVKDPSGLFTGSLFRFVDLKAGGFDLWTVFEHTRTGARRVMCPDGTTRKCDDYGKPIRRRRRKCPTLLQEKTAQGLVCSAGNVDRQLPA